MASMGQGGLVAGSPQQAREGFEMFATAGADPATSPDVAEVSDREVAGPDGMLRARIYRPRTSRATVPTIAFFHGGGFVVGSINTHDGQARLVCPGYRRGRRVVRISTVAGDQVSRRGRGLPRRHPLGRGACSRARR